MYTQSYKMKETNVVSFPNKDYILQMQALDSQKRKQENSTQEKPVDNEQQNATIDSLLIIGVLLAMADSDNINTKLFQLIAGILLSL